MSFYIEGGRQFIRVIVINMKDETDINAASPENSTAISRLIYIAGQGHLEPSIYDLIFTGPPGPTPERLGQMERLLNAEARSWFHHSFYDVAEVDGRVAASLCAFSKEEGRARWLVAALREIGWDDADLVAMGERLQPVIRVEPRIPAGAWVIENVAAFPEFRRRGLVNALLERAIEKGRTRGHDHFQIGCVIGNETARAAYEKTGFRVTDEKTDDEFERAFGSPGMWRMTLKL